MKLYQNERGQSIVEYALILVLVVIVVLLIFRLLGPAIEQIYQNLVQNI